MNLLQDFPYSIHAACVAGVNISHFLHVLGRFRKNEQVAFALLLLNCEVDRRPELTRLLLLGELVSQRGNLCLN